MALAFDYQNLDQVWKVLWRNSQWMKIKLFMWLVQQKKILTWENLLKRGFVGPFKCHLCGLQEETMEYLLNLCPFTSTLWDLVALVLRKNDKYRLNITNTLKNWRKDFSGNEIINKASTLVPGFIIWDVLKECNGRIFNNKTGSTQNIIAKILRQLKDTVGALMWKLPKNPPLPQDAHILL